VGKGLAGGVVELRDRRTGEREEIGVGEIVKRVAALVHG
jgi:prolyl-tRNA synthetase